MSRSAHKTKPKQGKTHTRSPQTKQGQARKRTLTNPTLLQAAKETATRAMKPVGSPLCVFYLSALTDRTLQHITPLLQLTHKSLTKPNFCEK